ncbi:MAG: pyridoxamine 5'-phosphate oxidase family protein [Acidobacteria bacterium]|nr:pyridoxamine 5'-phosphate oxidase family protein [Acidobacteriota bacterium]
MAEKMRRTDRVISENEAQELLRAGEYGTLSTVSPDGQPYGVPVNYSYSGDGIYFHCALEGHKLANLKGNNKVSFCVVGETRVLPDKFTTRYESVIVFGKAFELADDEKHRGLVELVKKYSPGFMEKGLRCIEKDGSKTRVYKISIESMSGKASSEITEA